MDTPETATIYGLCDPRDGTLRYVGSTTMPLLMRLFMHCTGGTNPQRRAWIQGIKTDGMKPEIFEIETVPVADRDTSEMFWIHYFHSIGCQLTNAKGLRRWNKWRDGRKKKEGQ